MSFLSACGKETGQFTLSTYERYLVEFPSDKSVGTIKSPRDAKQKALSVWFEIFGKESILEWPYKISYDPDNKAWLVTGSLPLLYNILGAFGGAANIIFQEDGKVLAVWHDA